MAGSYNRVLVGGALTREPRLRFLADGTAEADFGILLERNADPVIPLEVRCRGALAERVVAELDRGERALIAGRLSNGADAMEIVAHQVLALGTTKGESDGSPAQGRHPQAGSAR